MATPSIVPKPAAWILKKRTGFGGATQGRERAIEYALLACAGVAIVVTAGILAVLLLNSLRFFQEVGVLEFLLGTKWNPDIAPVAFGVLPLVNGTLMVTLGAALLAVPLGILTAIYLSEFAHPKVRALLKPTLELLAGIPSIAFGLFALLVVSPLLQEWFGAQVFNALNAVIVLAFMVLPIVTTFAEDAIRAVPQELRAGALALGATKWEVTKQVVVPAALSGIVAGILLGFSRAIGETMAVALAAGAQPRMTLNYLESVQTMTAFIAQRAQGDLAQAGPSYYSLFAVGLLLFLMTFGVNVIAQRFLRRYREAY